MKETIKIKNNMDNQALKKLVIEKISDVARLNTTSFCFSVFRHCRHCR